MLSQSNKSSNFTRVVHMVSRTFEGWISFNSDKTHNYGLHRDNPQRGCSAAASAGETLRFDCQTLTRSKDRSCSKARQPISSATAEMLANSGINNDNKRFSSSLTHGEIHLADWINLGVVDTHLARLHGAHCLRNRTTNVCN